MNNQYVAYLRVSTQKQGYSDWDLKHKGKLYRNIFVTKLRLLNLLKLNQVEKGQAQT